MDNLDCYKNLGAAIVLQAYKDYCRYARKYKGDGVNKELYLKGMREIVDFVKSDWYTVLTSIPQRVFLDKLSEVMKLD